MYENITCAWGDSAELCPPVLVLVASRSFRRERWNWNLERADCGICRSDVVGCNLMGCGRTVSTPLFEWLRLVADDHFAPTVNGSKDPKVRLTTHLLPLACFPSTNNSPLSSSSQISVEHKMFSRADAAAAAARDCLIRVRRLRTLLRSALKRFVLSRVDINDGRARGRRWRWVYGVLLDRVLYEGSGG